jgi:NAD(P)H dehydrogenase (quinone)
MKDSLVGKVGSVFTSSATQHGGQESTILTFHPVLLHLGRQPSPVELDGVRYQGKHVAEIAAKLTGPR